MMIWVKGDDHYKVVMICQDKFLIIFSRGRAYGFPPGSKEERPRHCKKVCNPSLAPCDYVAFAGAVHCAKELNR